MRRVFGVILAAFLLITAVAGCSSSDNHNSKNNKNIEADKTLGSVLSTGRYVEEDLVFPEGVAPNEFISITASPNGELELYAYNNDSYKKYIYTDQKWSMG